jgi:uncharacterized protein (DUF2235 family)
MNELKNKLAWREEVMANLIIYSDGTGQRGGLAFDERRSNVYKLFRSTRCGPDSSINPADQLTFYDPGLGTAPVGHTFGLAGALTRSFRNLVSQATGLGITHNIIDCYAAIIRLWRPGDRMLLFGFSRGAYTVRCLSAVISMCGVPTRDKDGQPLRRDQKTVKGIASEAVKNVYQYTESVTPKGATNRQKKLLTQRAERARNFRERYASGNAADANKANVYPYFIGVFDSVASIAKPIMTASLFVVATLLLAAPSWILLRWFGFNIGFWIWFAAFALALVVVAAVIVFESTIWWWPFHIRKLHMELEETSLSNEVEFARHALAIDEHRRSFKQVPWGGSYTEAKDDSGWFEQRWFAGNHSDIGGSYPENESRLSDISLRWMVEEAAKAGLKIDSSVLHLYPDATGPQHDETRKGFFHLAPKWLRPIPSDAILDRSVFERLKAVEILNYDKMQPYRPENLRNHGKAKEFFGGG